MLSDKKIKKVVIQLIKKRIDNNIPPGFSYPTALPNSPNQQKKWQKANKTWWENNPMRYDREEEIAYKEFTEKFYNEIDSRFFSDARAYMPWNKIPFDFIVDFVSLSNKDVLEIGVGNGSHAKLLAQYARTFIGIDITKYAVKSTLQRMNCFNLKAKILQMDAEELMFADNSFDFIWSWGVIHHSANTRKILEEIYRVLRPEGIAITMVYHRNFWNYYVMNGFFRGILGGDFSRTKYLHKIVQWYSDGAIARYYTIREWKSLVSDLFLIEKIAIFGSKAELIPPLLSEKLGKTIIGLIPNKLSRFLTNQMKIGNFLVSVLKKK